MQISYSFFGAHDVRSEVLHVVLEKQLEVLSKTEQGGPPTPPINVCEFPDPEGTCPKTVIPDIVP